MIEISTRTAAGKVAVALAVAVAIALAWFGVRWQIGNMLGELTPPSGENALEVAQAAVNLSGRDPLPRWLLATKLKEDFTPESVEASIQNFRETIRLSPNDYRWWIELGRALEQAERTAEAEAAFTRAIELAPAYTFPQWQIGNFYLRQDRTDEAFAYLTRATEKSRVYREQVFALAWDYFDKDPAKVEQLAADVPDVRVTLALFYARRGAAADAARIWATISDDEKAKNPVLSRTITQLLYSKRAFRETLEFARQAGIDPESKPEVFSNASFEKFVGDPEETMFGWKIYRNDSKLEIQSDSNARTEGQRSLRLVFKNYAKPELLNVSQLIVVEPLVRYRVTFMLRTENLRTGGEPLIEVVDSDRDTFIVRSQPFPLGTSDWQQVALEFVVPEGCDGVTVRTGRVNCGENCPISGTIWYDDFKLERLTPPAGS